MVDLQEDPLRDLLLFPDNDFSVSVCVCVEAPSPPFPPPQACKYYNSELNVVQFKYDDYAGDYRLLPSITLHIVNWCISVQSFKRRYFQLTQLTDSSYIMNFYKDEKISKEPKGCIFLDSCTGVVQNNRLRKHAFELKMNEVTYFVLAAESEQDMEDWISTLARILQITPHDGPTPDRKSQDLTDHRQGRPRTSCGELTQTGGRTIDEVYGVTKGQSAGSARPLEERLGRRLMLSCRSLGLTLQGCLNEAEAGAMTNIEPFFVTLALLDVREGRKMSADFHVDLNHETVRQMLGPGAGGGGVCSNGTGSPVTPRGPETAPPAIFSVTNPHTDIVILARVEKVLMGNIACSAEPYIKNTDSSKTVQKMLKSNKQFCSKLGKYRMPFAWCIRSVFKDNQGTLDRESRFSPLFKQESNKISTEDLIKMVSEYRKAEKTSKLQTIPGNLDINVDYVPLEHPNCVTSSYVPVKPFEDLERHPPTVEVEEFVQDTTKFTQPYRVYKNHIYVYPKHLKYDSQKSFAKARNLAVYVEFRSSDEEVAKSLKCIYGKPGGPLFTTSASSTVLHHCQNPDFYDEVKLELPIQLHEKHHLLFSFYHVTCDINAKTNVKRKEALETPVGYSWLPLLREGRLASQEFSVPVSCSLPPGYRRGPGGGVHGGGSDVKWVDGGKPIFKVSTNVLSTVYTQVSGLSVASGSCEAAVAFGSLWERGCVKPAGLVPEWDQPVGLLPCVHRVLLHIVAKCHEENLDHYLHSYIKVRPSERAAQLRHLCISEGGVLSWFLSLLPQFSWFFFELIIKSMAQHLVQSDTVKLPRPQRFPSSYLGRLETLLETLSDHVYWKHKELPEETRSTTLAVRCFTLMDRGFTFKLISNYVTMITASDSKMLCELKFEFLREVCNHEHYIPLSLPLPSARITGRRLEYTLTGEFCRKHFLTGLLLRELGLALQDEQDLRHLALATLKTLMAKHSLDGRYATKEKQARIASLYLPLYGLILDNMPRFFLRDMFPIYYTSSTQGSRDDLSVGGVAAGGLTPHVVRHGNSVDASFSKEVLNSITGTFSSLAVATGTQAECRGSLLSVDSNPSWHYSAVNMLLLRTPECVFSVPQFARPQSLIGYGSRCDKLDQAETRSLLMCFLSLTLSCVCMFVCVCVQKQLLMDEGQNVMKKVLDTYLLFFQINQSTTTLRHVFAALRLFVQKFPSAFFQGKADLCGCLCYEILKCCNHRSSSTQTEASALLYCVMRHNFEFTKGKSMVRSHLQVIKAVSQLIADAGIGGSRFQQSLAIINNFANGDAPLKSTPFPAEVKDLTKRIRTVLMATAQMKEHEKDPEMLVDLQVSLANSYASTPELRRTWLESMAKVHVRNGDLSEAAMCYIHISALIAESLKRRGEYTTPAVCVCDTLVEQLELCVDYLWKSERYELIADINKPIIAVFEKRRDFKRLSELYYDIHRSYLKVTEVVNSEKRLFGRYYRVAFYGQGFFEEEESKEFIYKEPKLTGLSEISQRLLKLYSDKFGADNVKMIQDSNKVNPKDLDPRFAYIQVTYVVPFFDGEEEQDKRTDFEKHHNISRFVFETPFTLSGKKHGEVEEQCKRRTVLTSSSFPYLKKRIQVVEQQSTEMNPLEVAIDEMSRKVSELNALCSMQEVDMIRLQLKLQGSVSAKVNAGPMAYARAFLEEKNAKKYPDNQVKLLKEIFRRFADACGQALDVNERLIKEDQLEYQEEMRAHYRDLLSELSAIMNEQV
uniref:Dedicator of cytokinesis 10 n=1 Tax=Gadus morhua TaxID=8049 RepID=A0A8C5ABD2_GADMO